MIQGGGKLVIGSGERYVGAGHFGLFDEGQGVQKFSLHWEADLERGGGSVLDIRPLIWEDGWPVAGENLKEGTYQVLSYRTGTALELAVEGLPVGRSAGGGRGGRGGFGGGGMRGGRGGGGAPVADQTAADVMENWPAGNIDARLSNYMCQAQQKWTITPAEGKGGYLGAPYFKIQIAGTDRVLAAAEGAEVVTLPSYTGADEQLWRIEQLTDGKWRIMPKAIPGTNDPMALSAVGASSVTLEKFDPEGLKQRWLFKAP
jgi:arabinan endo-1,5-alpha-L-arabinosidase